ncbi:hypothetical protein [Nostoc sp.]|uniref:hypothetical protein n=1 Tax=Nostoc sp. TaxID=1180 RepID=UPI002FF9A2B4
MSTVAKNGIQREFYPSTALPTSVDSVDALQPHTKRSCHCRLRHCRHNATALVTVDRGTQSALVTHAVAP